MLLLILAIGFLVAAWHDWLRERRRWTSPQWRSILAAVSLVILTISFAIYLWVIGSHKSAELFWGTLMNTQPWPRIAAWGSIASIPLALVGKKGVRFFVVSAALALQFSIFAAVMAD
jgi:hypothetical protein